MKNAFNPPSRQNGIKIIWGKVGQRQWRDWRWQLRNRLTRVSQFTALWPPGTKQPATLEAVTALYPFCVTPYYLSLCKLDDVRDPIRRQFFPDGRERLAVRTPPDPLGEKRYAPAPGLIHRYRNRVVIITTNDCAVRCRHCTRKNTLSSFGADNIFRRLPRIVKYIRERKEIREVIISGGDPLLLETEALDRLMGELRSIKNVEVLRIGTRAPVVLPMRIDAELCACLKKHRPLWVNTQFNHPQEITPEAAQACRRLQEAGLPVSNQAVLLRGVNNSLPVLKELCNGLQRIMVRPYYIFQCDRVRGTKHFRVPLVEAVNLSKHLREQLGGLSMPLFVSDIPGQKCKIPLEAVFGLPGRQSAGRADKSMS